MEATATMPAAERGATVAAVSVVSSVAAMVGGATPVGEQVE